MYISADIFTLIGNSREGAAAKKRRQLERKLNSMKTDMEKVSVGFQASSFNTFFFEMETFSYLFRNFSVYIIHGKTQK